ncbi:MAG TPA: alpha/beta hydrolase-fold protein [Bacteroidota bacterium]|nr:alpha/beta hydrolase-fold protein [Bacteroidota bacterium]
MCRIRSIFVSTLLLSTCLFAQETFDAFIVRANPEKDSVKKSALISEYLSKLGEPFIEGDVVHFYYRGKGNLVEAPGELNSWTPPRGSMIRLTHSDFFYRSDTLPQTARVEYKLRVDSTWILDPLNPRKAAGGFGDNSDLWMPQYRPYTITYDPAIPHGRLDTLWIESKYLKRTHPVIVYYPPDAADVIGLPTMIVTDGADYITLGSMTLILDDLIDSKRIKPVVGLFVDPRSVLNDNSTNERMSEYGANDAYLDFLQKEVVPAVEKKYPVSKSVNDRVMIGASMGGLISTYAVLARRGFVTKAGAQSPAFLQADSAVMKLSERIHTATVTLFMSSGTIHDTQKEATFVRDKLLLKGARIKYLETPEGHNWTNWRKQTPLMLEYFFAR